MLKIENFEVIGWEHAIRGMRNSMNSWDKSDSGICKGGDNGIGCENCANNTMLDNDYDLMTKLRNAGCEHTFDHSFQLGVNDYDLMTKLRNAGTDHRKFMRMITVYVDITAPLYWWKEFDTYKVGTVANSCSTMHKIAEKEFTLEDFSHEHLISSWVTQENLDSFIFSVGREHCDPISPTNGLETIIELLNTNREMYLKTKNKLYWWQMIQLLPSSYNQKRTIMLNYEVLANLYKSRRNHELDEWHTLCDWIESLPYSELITSSKEELV